MNRNNDHTVFSLFLRAAITLLSPFCSRPSVASESSSSSSPFLIKASSTGTSSLASCPSSSSIASQRLQGKKYLKPIIHKNVTEKLPSLFRLKSPQTPLIPFHTTQWRSTCILCVKTLSALQDGCFVKPVALIMIQMTQRGENDILSPSYIIMTYVVSSLLSTISTLSKNQPALAWLLSCRILSFFRIPRSTAVMLKMSSWVTCERGFRLAGPENLITYLFDLYLTCRALKIQHLLTTETYPGNSIVDNNHVEHSRSNKYICNTVEE